MLQTGYQVSPLFPPEITYDIRRQGVDPSTPRYRPVDRVAAMDVSLLYFEGCPNHHATQTLLETLLSEAGWDGDVQLINVDSQRRAEELGFRGSPTILINGDDPFLDTDAPVGLSCRIYAANEGYRGNPPECELRAAIARSIGE